MDQDLQEALLRDLDGPLSADAAQLVRHVAAAFGPETAAIIHYGSHAHRSGGRPESAYDFFVVVDRYRPAYESFVARTGPRFGAWTAILLAWILPPNVLAVTSTSGTHSGVLLAKCAVLSRRDLAACCARRSRDHFTRGRLFQQVQLAWARDDSSRAAVRRALLSARASTFDWGRADLPRSFDAETYCRVLLATSYAGEIRPETRARVDEVFTAQRDIIVPMYDALLRNLVGRGNLEQRDAAYTQKRLPTKLERLGLKLYFRRSKLRATLRWAKHVWLYDDWLEYIRQKIARRSGMVIELSPRERRWPLLFLWPKAIRYLRTRR